MDAARTAIRLGCEEARVLYRRGRAEMPAAVEEVEQGLQEGVILQTQIVPSRVLVIGAKVTGLGCRRTKPGEPDASGRRRPVVIEGSDFEASGDLIIVAAGQQTDPTVFSKLEGLLQQNGKLKVDPDTLQTTQKKIFGAGDTVTGPATVIEAVAQGRQAAQSIHRLLRDGTTRRSSPGSGGLNGVLQLDGSSRDFSPRIALPLRPERHSSFAESELCLDPGAAMTEAARCLKCGSCSSCRLCWSACRWSPRAIEPSEPEPFARVERQLLDVESAGTRMKITEAPADATALASLVCTVRADRCRGCGMCKDACAFDAVQLEAGVARMDPALCRGCGICAGECPSGAVDAGPMDDAALRRQMRDARGASIVIRCQWCEPAQDNDAVEIRVPCAGRVSAGLVLYALAQGVPRVTVAACAEDRCKYGRGPHLVSERLSWLLACEPERVRQLGKAPCPA
jgi:ferredoxin